MSRDRPTPLEHLGLLLAHRPTVSQRELAPGVFELRLDTRITRWMGFPVSAYLVDELLLDTGFAHGNAALIEALEGVTLRGIALTHHHEDHAGNAAAIAARHGCPVYLREPTLRGTEGLDRLPPYRQVFYGEPPAYDPQPMPTELHTGARTLHCVATRGHSGTHTVFFEPQAHLLFSGDLYVSRGASAVMRHEDPFALARSLRCAARLGPRRMLTGHGGDLEGPTALLDTKAQRIEDAIERVLELHVPGASTRAIRDTVFPGARRSDPGMALLTQGEFSRGNFVRAVIRQQSATARG